MTAGGAIRAAVRCEPSAAGLREDALERARELWLRGEKLHGGFALQRTRPGAKAQWLLVKRRDESARPGSDVVAECPSSVLSGRTLGELLR